VNLAGEFMVMAATLMQMKSAMLLPREEGENGEQDPRLPLVAQLLEYEQFKKAANEIDERPWLHRDIFIRPPGIAMDAMPVESLLEVPIEPVDMFQLLLCLKAATNRTTRKPLEISTDPTSIKEKVTAMSVFLDQTDIMEFALLLPPLLERRSRDVIVSFLAVLELAKLKYIEIIQHETFGPIQIRAVRSLRELNAGLLDQY
jgi:segregation and condensation protein A